jgi:predicted TIM-barrel fold metal-dependent hydrolase
MIIDCHTHIGRNEHINASVDELLLSMDKARIDKSLVFGGLMNDCPNDYLIEQVDLHRDRLYAVAAYHHNHEWEYPGYFQQLYKDKKIVAVKFYTGYDHYYPEAVGDYLYACEEVGCPVIFHCGDCLNTVKTAKLKYAHPLLIDDVAVNFPKLKVVIAHMGYPWHRDAGEVCYKNDNVSSDISGFVYGSFNEEDKAKFRRVLSEFVDVSGQGRLLFGSDWPISNQKSYVEVIDGLMREGGNFIHDWDFLLDEGPDHVFKLGLDR